MAEYIDRELALSHPFANGQYDHKNANEEFILGHKSYKEWLEDLPTADVKPVVHGHWTWEEGVFVYGIGRDALGSYRCSACSNYSPHMTIYCPICGARMAEDG